MTILLLREREWTMYTVLCISSTSQFLAIFHSNLLMAEIFPYAQRGLGMRNTSCPLLSITPSFSQISIAGKKSSWHWCGWNAHDCTRQHRVLSRLLIIYTSSEKYRAPYSSSTSQSISNHSHFWYWNCTYDGYCYDSVWLTLTANWGVTMAYMSAKTAQVKRCMSKACYMHMSNNFCCISSCNVRCYRMEDITTS